jgi:beta-mannosidase
LNPNELEQGARSWIPALVPGTVAQALRAAGAWHLDRVDDFDDSDWWYRCRLHRAGAEGAGRVSLVFQGLATLAEVWLNGELILTADNMFREYRVEVGDALQPASDLVICFRSLNAALARRRPRPRWKTSLVSHQQLRWIRTTLLGRIPGWSPPVAPVGPWRDVLLEECSERDLIDVTRSVSLDDSGRGAVEISCWTPSDRPGAITAELIVGDVSVPLTADPENGGHRLRGRAVLRNPQLWWPHTHGIPHLYSCRVQLTIDGEQIDHEYDPVGFRRLAAGPCDGSFGLQVNGCDVFCRGACWTCSDIVTLDGSRAELSSDLTRMRDAGANMIRIGGTMVYESDDFYRCCDELGLLVWQDFMFANMDYPANDDAFVASVTAEVEQQLRRLRPHPSIAVYCGNSEVEQQAAMLGMPKEIWRSRLFGDVLPELCDRLHPGVPYVPSTPSGGALPFHVAEGVSHYYGVGAYLRPTSDVRRADVKFTPECLGFANVPEPPVVDALMHGAVPATHDPRWKRRTPRDTGAGWDFEDVRDHYLQQLFAVDPARLRATDPRRYLDLSRVTTGEVMSRVFAEWRSGHSHCRGGLVWFLKDLWAGAGWGVLDSTGEAKACLYYLQRAWAPQTVLITDEGLDGLQFHVINDCASPLEARLDVTLLRDGHVVTAQAETACHVQPRDRATFGSDDLLGGFHDVSYAYRFGPPAHTVVAATLLDDSGTPMAEAFWFPDLAEMARPQPAVVRADAEPDGDRVYAVTLKTTEFLYGVRMDVNGFRPSDSYFCLMPGRKKIVRLRPAGDEPVAFAGYVEALNLPNPVRIETGNE